MNLMLKKFIEIGVAIAQTQIPAIATVELAVKKLGSGKDKKEAVLEMIKLTPEIAELFSHRDIIDEKLFSQGVSKLNDGYVDILNSITSSKVEGDKK